MNDIKVFENCRFGSIRVVERSGEPWFVAKDVCECLGLTDVSASCLRLDDDEKVVVQRSELSETFSESSNAPTMTLISESGLYTLIMRSNKPDAKAFRKWVTSDVLPSIRKHGFYGTDAFVQKAIENPDAMISLLQQYKFEREQKQLALQQRDEAIRTKAWIGSKREATCMNEVKRFKRENEDLRDQLGDSTNYKSVKSISFIGDYFPYLNRRQWNVVLSQIGTAIGRICKRFNFAVKRIQDPNYGFVNAYDVRAIDIFRQNLDSDLNYMGKYRFQPCKPTSA